MGMFKRHKSKSADSQSLGDPSPSHTEQTWGYYDDNIMPPPSPSRLSTASAPTVSGQQSKKKKGLGSKLKGLVGVKRYSFSDSKSVGSHYSREEEPSGPPQVLRQTKPILPLHQEEEESSYESYSSSEEQQFRNPLKTVAEVNEDDFDSDGELRVKPTVARQYAVPQKSILKPSSRTNSTQSSSHRSSSSSAAAAAAAAKDSNSSLVILLVDPQSKRFELLQFQQPPNNNRKKKNVKIKTVLKQFQKSITETSLKQLSFCGLVDRWGQVYKPNATLSQAIQFDKDILVGLVQGVDIPQLLQSVRPILGDAKMNKLLDMNGFDTKGWVKKKRTKDSILDKKPPSTRLVQEEKQGSLLSVLLFTCVIATIVYGVDKLLNYLDAQGAFVQPLPDWPTVVEQASDVVLEGVQAAKEALVDGNSTAIQAMANSTLAKVEETAMEAVLDMKDLGFDITAAPSPRAILDSAKDTMMSMMTALPAAKVIQEANVTDGIATVRNEILANATKAIQESTKNVIKTPPNSVWEDYVLIGLLVCWLLYWMAI